MKKAFITLLALACSLGASAQKNGYFNFGIGLNVGTNGVGLDASIGLTRFIQIRGGVSYVPNMDFHAKANVYNEAEAIIDAFNLGHNGISIPGIPQDVEVKIQPNMTTYHALLDLYPSGSFHFTVGAYFGQQDVIRLYTNNGSMQNIHFINTEVIDRINAPVDHVGINVAGNLLTPDAQGNVEGVAKVQKIRPYFGLGFGRGVPRHHRMGCSLDFGVQYWGTPKYESNGFEPEQVPSTNNFESLASTLSTLPVYPVVTLRLCGRIL